MEWLSAHHVVLDYFNNVVTLNIPGKPVIRYQGDRSAISPCLISALTARKLLAKGCQGILAYVLDTKMKVQVVKDFLDVPEELPRLPPGKQNEFGIDVPQLFPTMYDRLKEIRGRIFFNRLYLFGKIGVHLYQTRFPYPEEALVISQEKHRENLLLPEPSSWCPTHMPKFLGTL